MAAANMNVPPPAAPKPAHDALASTLQAAATAVEAVYADSYHEPGEIATDDAGASRLAAELNRSPEAKRRLEKAS